MIQQADAGGCMGYSRDHMCTMGMGDTDRRNDNPSILKRSCTSTQMGTLHPTSTNRTGYHHSSGMIHMGTCTH